MLVSTYYTNILLLNNYYLLFFAIILTIFKPFLKIPLIRDSFYLKSTKQTSIIQTTKKLKKWIDDIMEKRSNVISIEAYKVKKNGMAGIIAEMMRVQETRKEGYDPRLLNPNPPAPAHFCYHKRKRLLSQGNNTFRGF